MIDEKKLVEAVARGICESYFENNIIDRRGYKRAEFIEKFWQTHIHHAQAAIKAYREQLKAMGE